MGCAGSKDVSETTAKKAKPGECGSHLKSKDELVDFPKFPAGTKSLLSKHITQEIWDQLKDTKDKHNFDFRSAIFSGC